MDNSASDSLGSLIGNEDVNAYGSLVQGDEAIENSGTEERIRCDCKGQCARKRGKGACKCREGNLKCDDLCTCDKNRCKNKANAGADGVAGDGVPPQSVTISDGELRFEQEATQAENEIKGFVATLDAEKKDKVLIKLLGLGRGSLDFAKNFILGSDDPEDPEPPSEDLPEWCKCRVCRPMPDEQENVCCKRVTCVTNYTSFSNICLDRDILEVCIKARCDIRADEFNFSMESFRKAGYRQYALWRYGKLGRGNRRVIPACVVRRIRTRYPAPDGRYMGFRAN